MVKVSSKMLVCMEAEIINILNVRDFEARMYNGNAVAAMVDLTTLTSDKFPPTPACINVYQFPRACCNFEVFRIYRYDW